MSHLFISYARRDAEFAQKLNAGLHDRGVATWIDELGIRSGADWPDRIATAIEDCTAMLIVLTPDSMNSKWVRRELEFADARDKKILPLLHRHTKLPSTYELRFGSVQRADFTHGDFDDNLAQLIVSIEQELGFQISAPSDHPARQEIATTERSFEADLTRVHSIEELRRVQGKRAIWEKDGKEMVRVTAGRFPYGEKREEPYLPEYWIDKTPVTFAEYARFVAATGREPPDRESEEPWNEGKPPYGMLDHPVDWLTWDDAVAYAEWAGKQLPSEEEWEKAARGTDGRKYPWGDQEPTDELCNFDDYRRGTTPVGRYSPQGDSPYGCVDMSGNVYEWTASWYDEKKEQRVIRGGNYDSISLDVEAAHRTGLAQRIPAPFGPGFRTIVITNVVTPRTPAYKFVAP